jgi:2-polyprenyl-6-hydroxyphenyl methylase / 3-demethylubiquinone-9 3-methyltransferase
MSTGTYVGAHADAAEVGKFEADAGRWWELRGPFAPLHRMNPARIGQIVRWLGGSAQGLKILDVGCGGGIAAEALARRGAAVTGLDASPGAIEAARAHAAGAGLDIAYRAGTLEGAPDLPSDFDAVLALELVEHAPDPAALIAACARRARPGGAVIVSTLDRTAASYALAIVAAERVLRWLPPGTHDWRRFIRPHELAAHGRAAGLIPRDAARLAFDPLSGTFRARSGRTGVNYMLWLHKP